MGDLFYYLFVLMDIFKFKFVVYLEFLILVMF